MAKAIQLFIIHDPIALVSSQSLWIPEYSIILIAIVATVYDVVVVVFAEAEKGGYVVDDYMVFSLGEGGTVRGRFVSERGNKHGCRMQEDGRR